MKVAIAIGVLVVVLVVLSLLGVLPGGPGGHGPGRHLGASGATILGRLSTDH